MGETEREGTKEREAERKKAEVMRGLSYSPLFFSSSSFSFLSPHCLSVPLPVSLYLVMCFAFLNLVCRSLSSICHLSRQVASSPVWSLTIPALGSPECHLQGSQREHERSQRQKRQEWEQE